jgi:hypothetical protein
MKSRSFVAWLAILALAAGVRLGRAQGGSHIFAAHELGHETSPPLDKIPPIPPEAGPQQVIPLRRTHGIFTPQPQQADSALQSSATTSLATTPGVNFLGLGNGFPGFTVQYIPPDTNGAVGDTQFVEWVNASFAVLDKSTGKAVYGPAAGNTLWKSLGGPCARNNSGDPIAQFDKIADRWVLMQPVFKSPYYLCVAVSTSSDATGIYNLYSFAIPNSVFPDYPKLGVWPDGYYVTYNQFKGNTFLGAAACALDRANMLLGNAATMQCDTSIGANYGSMLPGDLDGSTLPSSGDYFVNLGPDSASLDLWQMSVDWANPNNSTLSGPTVIPVDSFTEACGGGACIPQKGTSQQLDSLGDRAMYRLAYRNFGSGSYESLVVNHSVDTGLGYTGVRWYELQNKGAGFALYQQGTYAPDSSYRWMGSIAQDKNGDIALGYSVSSGSMYPAISYAGRVPGDPAGTMESENRIFQGGGSQTSYTRWGDYSSMAIDPTDDCTFWYANEYQPVNGNAWATRIASFAFPGCGGTASADFSISASPSSQTVTEGQSGTSTITVSPVNGFTGTVNLAVTSGCPSSPPSACTLSAGSITNGSGSVTLTVTTDSTTAPGPYSIVVTGTSSGSLVHTTTFVLTVNAPAAGDFSISASPGNVVLKGAGAATYSVSVSPSNGYSGQVNLSLTSGLPAGANYNFSPASISNGSGASTLTVTTSSSTPNGNYALTITGSDSSGSPTHSTTVSLKVH